jgi:hypothetical protein
MQQQHRPALWDTGVSKGSAGASEDGASPEAAGAAGIVGRVEAVLDADDVELGVVAYGLEAAQQILHPPEDDRLPALIPNARTNRHDGTG